MARARLEVPGMAHLERTHHSAMAGAPLGQCAGDASQPATAPRIVIAIVNYCTAELTIDCLRSLAPELEGNVAARVIVADNASPDGSGHVIAKAIIDNGWTAWAAVSLQPRNGGFAYGNNVVVEPHLHIDNPPDYFWLLNSDTVVHPGALTNLVAFLDAHPHVGIAGSRLENPDGSQQNSAFRFHSIGGELEGAAQFRPVTWALGNTAIAPPDQTKTAPYDWVSGASMMIRHRVFMDIGLMNEGYFLYYEETDFCLKARRAGWSCWFVNDSRVIHLVGASSGLNAQTNARKRRSQYWFDSRRTYFIDNHGRAYAIAADLALALGIAVRLLKSAVTRREPNTPKHFLYDLLRNTSLWNGANASKPHRAS